MTKSNLSSETSADPRRLGPVQVGRRATKVATILLIEDNDLVRSLIARILERLGYAVWQASDAARALALCREMTEPIHMILCDVLLPKTSGTRVAEQLRYYYPDIKVLYTSGCPEDDLESRYGLKPGVPFLAKPFTPENLALKIKQVLES